LPARLGKLLDADAVANLSATGLSDIVPVTPPARVLAILEQFTGIGYVAMVVSRLVGLTMVRRNRNRES
jgi:hypothetical protein